MQDLGVLALDAHCLECDVRHLVYDGRMSSAGYLHGYTAGERDRLRRQARFLEPMVHDRLPYRRRKKLLEVGSGVGAQTEILLRHFPEIVVTGIEINDAQIEEARRFLDTVPWAKDR